MTSGRTLSAWCLQDAAINRAPTTAVSPLPSVSQLAGAQLAVQPVTELQHPVAFAWFDKTPVVFIADQRGPVQHLTDDNTVTTVLDISNRVTPYESGSERGRLALTFGPDGRTFVYFIDLEGDS